MDQELSDWMDSQLKNIHIMDEIEVSVSGGVAISTNDGGVAI